MIKPLNKCGEIVSDKGVKLRLAFLGCNFLFFRN